VISFSLNARNFFTSSLILSMPPDHGAMFIQSPGVLVFPAVSFVVDIYFYWFVVRQFSICEDMLCDLKYDLFWRKFPVLLRLIVLLQKGKLLRHLSCPFAL
jgi:hypothetical protein